jgi:hypothetical protein
LCFGQKKKESVESDFFLAISLHKGQLSCREVMNGEKLVEEIKTDEQLTINHINGPCSESESPKSIILNRGL